VNSVTPHCAPNRSRCVSQRKLARRLEVHESQVSRDERNEYFGITLESTIKKLDALNVRLRTKVVEAEPEKKTQLAIA
jgi:ribosome-binding protein aMBF1 (putative translation factor)